MDVHDLLRELEPWQAARSTAKGAEKPTLSAAYLLVGSELFLVERAAHVLLRLVRAGNGSVASSVTTEVMQGDEVDGAAVVDAANSMSLFGGERFVWLRRADKMADEGQKRIASYLERPNPACTLVMTSEKMDGRSKLVRAAKKLHVYYTCSPLRGRGLVQFVVDEAERRGHKLRASMARSIVDEVGSELWELADAVERLSLYVGPGQAIHDHDIDACLLHLRVETVWSVVDAITKQATASAVINVRSLLNNRESPLGILALISRQFRLLLKTKQGLLEGLNAGAAAQAAGTPPFKADEVGRAAAKFTTDQLQDALQQLRRADQQIKSSRESAESLLERTVIGLCLGPPATY